MDKGTPKEIVKPLFSEVERRSLVRRFISAYISGAVKLVNVTDLELNQRIYNMIMIALGAENAPHILRAKEMNRPTYTTEQAIDALLYLIVTLRNPIPDPSLGMQLEGVFIESLEAETRLSKIEATLPKVLETLQAVDRWQQKWEPTLKEAEKDYKDTLRHVTSP